MIKDELFVHSVGLHAVGCLCGAPYPTKQRNKIQHRNLQNRYLLVDLYNVKKWLAQEILILMHWKMLKNGAWWKGTTNQLHNATQKFWVQGTWKDTHAAVSHAELPHTLQKRKLRGDTRDLFVWLRMNDNFISFFLFFFTNLQPSVQPPLTYNASHQVQRP